MIPKGLYVRYFRCRSGWQGSRSLPVPLARFPPLRASIPASENLPADFVGAGETAHREGDTLASCGSLHDVVDLQLINTQRPGDDDVGLTPLSKKSDLQMERSPYDGDEVNDVTWAMLCSGENYNLAKPSRIGCN